MDTDKGKIRGEYIMDEKFELFLASVDSKNQGFVKELNDYLTQNNCKCEIKSAKSGFVVSYVF